MRMFILAFPPLSPALCCLHHPRAVSSENGFQRQADRTDEGAAAFKWAYLNATAIHIFIAHPTVLTALPHLPPLSVHPAKLLFE
ncbi:hypothetical protein [Geobacillus subterraneus]|uniref:hypothetical protein n=1 Tax=Geobacillus subterraneus TaxID=129338 RepID=UPI001442A7BC|nr:hypothetical protein [Geobacillus subterraneus]QIZ65957.1 hypothetical protein HF500_00610 [Geobacillus subterraneus]